MSTVLTIPEALPDLILAAPFSNRRKLVALAGPPASGKTTLAAELVQSLTERGHSAAVLPMDGFHLDNRLLSKLNLLHRKGSPKSFDASGLLRVLKALQSDEVVYFPLFDRKLDISIAGAGKVSDDCEIVIVEGNYLLFDAPIWRELVEYWDYSIYLNVHLDILETRLRKRWQFYNVRDDDVEKKITSNDLPNARLIIESALPANAVLTA
ncbi:Pantothenate kinase [Thalassovita autumnalis]|uniref:Pantothenate kinase n=1 Tax=Thalassovita autumnalis TaxID=2072972 RepID=A0A0P1FZ05_9RHOB|nr:hypothetical protein [Thalassovita autumnalis]CUH64675.1 Pantothenate kinase [Thalassovita autumnalis]CUH70260.1 Pantothenate kinase [Thalassovita autumnalis]